MFLKDPGDASRAELNEIVTGSFMKGLGLMGYDAVNVGRIDLLLPPELLRRIAASSAFPVLSANVRDTAGKTPFATSLVKSYGGVKVGIIGLVGTQQLGVPAPAGRDLVPDDPIAAARVAVAALRPTCRLVIVLSSLGVEQDARLAREVPGIDVILGSFSRLTLGTPRIEGGTLILHSGAKGMRVGKLELEVPSGAAGPWVQRQGNARSGERSYVWTLVPLEASLPDEPALAALLAQHNEQLRARNLLEQQAPGPSPSTAPAYVGAAACAACHPVEGRQWQESKHAQALAGLARKKQDATPECLPCHVTAYGDPQGYRPPGKGGVDLANVQCEACHGFGREHRGRGRIRRRVPEPICRRCHTMENSPTFQYEPYLKLLGAHAARYFTRPKEPRPPQPR